MEKGIVKLRFSAPVHFGEGRLADSSYTCDAATLFSAFFIEAIRLGCSDNLMDAVQSGNFAISDAFPFIDNILYLPKPMMSPGFLNKAKWHAGQDLREGKAYKELKYIPLDFYGDYFLGNLDPLFELECFELGVSSLQTKVNLSRKDKRDADPYHVGSYTFHENAGLYFIWEGSFDFEPILEQLQFSGLGGKRTSGYGRFGYSILAEDPFGSMDMQVSESPNKVLLATALPAEEELTDELLEGARYSLVRKGGFVQSATHSSSPQKKCDLHMFSAGSMFYNTFKGKVFDVSATPNTHPVYRYGHALWLEV